MDAKNLRLTLLASVASCLPLSAIAQQAVQPAGQSQLPPVDVIQKQKAAPAKKSVAKAAPKKKAPAPAPSPEPVVEAAPEPETANPQYGADASGPAAARAANGATPPVNTRELVPDNLENFAGAATNLDLQTLTERQPRNINEAFTGVPGVTIINDDAGGSHGGIGVRGSPPRRSRKVLVQEDGTAVNLSLWLDPSVHYYAPIDRVESVEVLRGTVINHGPNNNFGVVNIQNLSPFGPNETVISAAIGHTENKTGFFVDEDGEVSRGNNIDDDISGRWHVHTRQSVGNVGIVASYTGADVVGAWDTEKLTFNDFYGAIGWKGVDQDLVVSVVYARQDDNYDESNLIGDDDGEPGAVEDAFFDAKHCKTCFAPGAVFNNYTGEIYRAQATHNYFIDDDTTLTTRLYGGSHRRDRYQIVTLEDDPSMAEDPGIEPVFVDGDDGLFNVVLGEDGMFGRLRTFRHIGSEVRAEFANRPLVGGLSQDIQVGIRYEYQDLTNRNFLGQSGEILGDGDEEGLTIFNRSLESNAISAFLQSTIKATPDLNIVPGVRLEWYNVNRNSVVTAEEEGEAEENEDDPLAAPPNTTCDDAIGEDECLVIEGLNRDPFKDSTETFEVLPGIAFAYNGLYRTTIFGGYHRGLSTAVLRNEDFPAPDEIGDNFQLGIRSTAIRGFAFEIAGFHQRLKDFQYGDSFSSAGDRSFGRADEVEINGVELAGRLDSNPFTGGPYNFFGEAQYTYSRAIIEKGTTVIEDDLGDEVTVDLSGNAVPEVPFHIAAFTLGVENRQGWHWDASVTYAYRGDFFTDELNTAYGSDPEGENGEVPDVWLLSARANLAIGDTGASVFISGDNLTDELYITDREDGLKPGIGRTFWTGFKYKF